MDSKLLSKRDLGKGPGVQRTRQRTGLRGGMGKVKEKGGVLSKNGSVKNIEDR